MSRPFFVLFAHARTGSENLCRALGSGTEKPALAEPFNPRYSLWGEPGPYEFTEPSTEDSLNYTIDAISKDYSGIKTMTYHLTPELNEALTRRPGTAFLFLYRRDVFAAALSQEVAMVTRHWHTFDDAERADTGSLVSVDPAAVVVHAVRFLASQHWMQELAGQINAPYVSYEEIYESVASAPQDVVAGLCQSLGIAAPRPEVAHNLLSRSVVPIRNHHQVANLADVEDACSDLGL